MRSLLLCVMSALAACGPSATSAVRAPVTNQPVVETKTARPRLTLEGALAMMPEDTEVVFELDVAKLRQSILWERIEPWLREQGGEKLVELAQLCSFDPLRSIDTLLLGARGLGGASVDVTVFVRGIEQDAATACLERSIDRARERGEDRSLRIDGDRVTLLDGATVAFMFQFVDARTLLLVSRASQVDQEQLLVQAVARKPGDGLTHSASFQKLMARIDTHATVWYALNGRSSVFGAFPFAVDYLRGEIHAGSDPARAIISTLVVEVGSGTDASSLAQMFRMAIDTLKGGPFDDLTHALTVTEDGGDVVVDLRLDLAQLERIVGLFGPMFP